MTGGTSGIGLELLRQLYEGNCISVIARPSARLEKLRGEFGQVKIFEADLADMGSVAEAADQLCQGEQKIDILINNAAVQYTPHFLDEDFQFETIKREIDINLTSICTLTYLLMPSLLQTNPSMILNVNSGLALVPKTSSAIYCATKGALNIFSQSLGYQLQGTNIDVKQVFLPLVDTPMTEGRGKGKMPVEKVASEIIRGMAGSGPHFDIGKVRLLRFLNRLAPSLAKTIMKAG